jgi:hypothetical protein
MFVRIRLIKKVTAGQTIQIGQIYIVALDGTEQVETWANSAIIFESVHAVTVGTLK